LTYAALTEHHAFGVAKFAAFESSMFSFFRNMKFRKELEQAVADGVLTDDEVRYLEQRSEQLGIEQKFVDEVRDSHVQQQVKPILERVKATRRYSPDDEAELNRLAKDLRFEPQFGPEFIMYRALWELENTGSMSLRPIQTGIILTRGEKCYHSAGASWNQVKRVRERTGYIGGAVSFRVARGVRFSVGRAVPTYNEYEGLMEISPGVLYVTNEKLVFRGSKKSTSIPFGRLIDYSLYADGIELHKTSGKPDVFLMDPPDPEYTAALINTITAS
jgi:hypothetical protein